MNIVSPVGSTVSASISSISPVMINDLSGCCVSSYINSVSPSSVSPVGPTVSASISGISPVMINDYGVSSNMNSVSPVGPTVSASISSISPVMINDIFSPVVIDYCSAGPSDFSKD